MSLLVNYANSDDSDIDNDNITNTNLNADININLNYKQANHKSSKYKTNNSKSFNNDSSYIEFDNFPNLTKYVENKVPIDVSIIDIFSKLPAPIVDTGIIEPELIILPSKSELDLREKPPERKKIVINLPTIADSDSDSDNENGPNSKKIRKEGKCDLFNLLPAPKSSTTKELNRSLVPHSVSSKQKTSAIATSKQGLKSNASLQDCTSKSKPDFSANIIILNELPINPMPPSSATLLSGYYSESDNEESGDNYFSIDNDTKNRILSGSNNLTYFSSNQIDLDRLPKNSTNFDSFDKRLSSSGLTYNELTNASLLDNTHESIPKESLTSISAQLIGPMMGPSNKSEYVDNASLSEFPQDMNISAEYIGNIEPQHREAPRSRDFADFETAEIIEARIDDWMSGYEVQKVKDLTQEQSRISYSKKHNKDMPTMQQKRKHQITYLAYEAKERELELKNQWAENRFTKKQTQSKYGF